MKSSPLMLALCLLCSTAPVGAQTAEPAPAAPADPAAAPATPPEVVIETPSPPQEYVQSQTLADRLPPEQLIWLEDDDHPFLALQLPQTTGRAQGQLILLPDIANQIDQGLLGHLRRHLPDKGWSTLAVSLPPYERLVQAQDHAPLVAPVRPPPPPTPADAAATGSEAPPTDAGTPAPAPASNDAPVKAQTQAEKAAAEQAAKEKANPTPAPAPAQPATETAADGEPAGGETPAEGTAAAPKAPELPSLDLAQHYEAFPKAEQLDQDYRERWQRRWQRVIRKAEALSDPPRALLCQGISCQWLAESLQAEDDIGALVLIDAKAHSPAAYQQMNEQLLQLGVPLLDIWQEKAPMAVQQAAQQRRAEASRARKRDYRARTYSGTQHDFQGQWLFLQEDIRGFLKRHTRGGGS